MMPDTSSARHTIDALVIGGGPAGLMAADTLLSAGARVLLAEAKPTVGRKFLMAGKSGLNLTKAEDDATFVQSYGTSSAFLAPMIAAFGPNEAIAWAESLGQTVFTGTSGRVFPESMKASPLLRAWLQRLNGLGLDLRTNWRWSGWNDTGAAQFQTPDGPQSVDARVTVLATGGASWSRLGSDGAWRETLEGAGIATAPFAASNAGITVPWSDHMSKHFGGPVKNLRMTCGPLSNRGEVVLSSKGIEGGGLYPLGPALRTNAPLLFDLAPDVTHDALTEKLSKPRGKQSLSNHLRKTARLSPPALALLRECLGPLPIAPEVLAQSIKGLSIPYTGLRPIDEAISTVGGVPVSVLTPELMLSGRDGVYCAGEMMDWDAPTGGYLITACLATGLWAGRHAAQKLA